LVERGIRLQKVVGAAFLYFVLIFLAGTVMGFGRMIWLAPTIGPLLSTAAEVPVMLGIVWIASQSAVRTFGLSANTFIRLCVGSLAFILLQIGELALAYLAFGMDPAAYWRRNAALAGAVGLAAQLCVPWVPVLQSLIQRRRHHASAYV
jgi:hypothetical protein